MIKTYHATVFFLLVLVIKYLVDASVRHSANQDGVHNKHDHYFFYSDVNRKCI